MEPNSVTTVNLTPERENSLRTVGHISYALHAIVAVADRHVRARKPGLLGEGTASAALAGQAMADRDADRITADAGRQLAATAGCKTD